MRAENWLRRLGGHRTLGLAEEWQQFRGTDNR